MINLSKSYTENISAPDNKCYEPIINQILNEGKISEIRSLLLDAGDIANIVVLYCMMAYEVYNSPGDTKKPARIEYDSNGKAVYIASEFPHTIQKFKDKVMLQLGTGISDLFTSLDFEIKKQIIFSLGLYRVVSLGLDCIGEFSRVCEEMSRQYCSKQSPTKQLLPNCTK